MWKVAMTIAGLDSGGGAGIHADIKTFAALGVHGTTALTCVTAQNTYEVRRAQCLSPDLVRDQIMAVWDDMGIDAAKTGMLGTKEIIEEVAAVARRLGFPLVVDPVMIAKSGAPLIAEDAMEALAKKLLPAARVVTPNRYEAERLTGMRISSLEEAKRAAESIHREFGSEVVVVKGGHLDVKDAVDVVYINGSFHELSTPRLDPRATHGTGCSFSAAIAAGLAKGLAPLDAIKTAKELIYVAIKYGVPKGRGHWPVNPTAWLEIPAERWRAYEAMSKAIAAIERDAELFGALIPEVQSNLGYAIDPRYAESREDVLAIPGRIVRYMGRAKASGPPTFGASDHVARKILALLGKDAEARSAMNIRYSEELVEAARRLGYGVVVVDRRNEPKEVKEREGGSMQWVAEEALRQSGGKAPDVIVDVGDWGKEPLITIVGKTPEEVVEKAKRIASAK
nr:MAG: phosphomethylpyrimidine kinase [Thermoproteus sp. AZ2]